MIEIKHAREVAEAVGKGAEEGYVAGMERAATMAEQGTWNYLDCCWDNNGSPEIAAAIRAEIKHADKEG